jgi:hypothetical protein
MRAEHREAVAYAFAVLLGIRYTVLMFVVRLQDPALTETQLLINYWPQHLLAVTCIVVALWLARRAAKERDR